MHATLHTRYGPHLNLKVIEPKRSWFGLPRIGFAAGLSGDIAATIEDRALWARFGL
jgi:hypothetical protein